MRYEMIFSPEAEEDLVKLRASDRSKVLDAIETHLRHQPTQESKSRIKRLQAVQWPQYRLRVDDLRVFYDVVYTMETRRVEILVILNKLESIEWLQEFGYPYENCTAERNCRRSAGSP